jgi:glycosyltransferase involved in cell wall biosynthesis
VTKPSIALVVPDLTVYSGVPAVALFLHRIISDAGRHVPQLISVATSARDRNSVRLTDPRSWGKPRISVEETRGYDFKHVGAVFTEFEFQRYRPRRVLTEELQQYDLVQIVAGTPPWTLLAKDYDGPIALQVATLTDVERETMLRHTTGARRTWMKLMSRYNTALEPEALRLADAVFVENSWMYDRLLAEFGPDKIVFAAPGVDTEFYQPATDCVDGPILSVGRFADPRKNVPLLFRAYQLLRQSRTDAPKLVLAGETAPSDGDMTLAAELGIAGEIEIHRAVSLERLRELYQTASMFVLSSNEEGLGIVILEAMACGLPVVSTRCGGPETSVIEGVTGYLTPLDDAQVMAERMGELLDNPTRSAEMGATARTRAVEEFSLAATGRVYLEKYDQLLAERGRRSVASR